MMGHEATDSVIYETSYPLHTHTERDLIYVACNSMAEYRPDKTATSDRNRAGEPTTKKGVSYVAYQRSNHQEAAASPASR